MQDTTYIPAVLTAGSKHRVLAHMCEVTGSHQERVTKKGLKAAIAGGVTVEYISRSMFHRYGAYFTGPEAVQAYGSVGVEVRDERDSLIAVVRYSAHPSFGGTPVNEYVGAVVS